jgi:hypothetical protein
MSEVKPVTDTSVVGVLVLPSQALSQVDEDDAAPVLASVDAGSAGPQEHIATSALATALFVRSSR